MATSFGGPKDGFVCVLIATRDWTEGEQLQTDHALNFEEKKIEKYPIDALNMHKAQTLPTNAVGFEHDFGADG